MVRIVGILCGSALAISFLILALGVPEFLPKTDVPTEVLVEVENNPGPVQEPEPEHVEEMLVDEAVEPVPEEVPDESFIEESLTEESLTEKFVAQPSTAHWYAFWSPFRSELAANGFVSQLQKTTGMDYRVVRLKPGVYEVAFAYEAEADIETKLSAISAATGLEMPDG